MYFGLLDMTKIFWPKFSQCNEFLQFWRLILHDFTDLAICEVLNDDEILNKTVDEKGNDEEECSEETILSSNVANLDLRAVLNCLQRHGIDESVFCNILNLYNTIDRVNPSGYTQTNY
jgi:hypothetical protein